ncbi:MAG TPA: hypothetical protein VJ302_13560 [Blastocatellia bacterium]|nr:hypothetical protein [Blastocatellia bacterium]
MNEREDFSAVSSQQAKRTLLATFTYHSLSIEEQLSVSERLTSAYLRAFSKQHQVDPDQALQSLEDDGLAAEFLNQLAFPKFVGDLIDGLFEAAVQSSLEQMEAYLGLMKACTGSLSKFASEIDDRAAADYLEALFRMADPEFGRTEALPPKPRKSQLKAAKLVLAGEQRRLLRQVVLIGIARLFVDRRPAKTQIFLGIRAERDAFDLNLREKIIDAFPSLPRPRPAEEGARGFGLTPGTAAAVSSGELSGAGWVARFPGSNSVEVLEAEFRNHVRRFMAALKAARAGVVVNSTFRPPERAYLMHWSWKIVNGLSTGQDVPPLTGVAIAWWHGNLSDTKRGAQEMVDGYGIGHLKVAPALASRHTQRRAIDMKITWEGSLKIKRADGKTVAIASLPKNGANQELIQVGSTYQVFHLQPPEKDVPHWSTDGR